MEKIIYFFPFLVYYWLPIMIYFTQVLKFQLIYTFFSASQSVLSFDFSPLWRSTNSFSPQTEEINCTIRSGKICTISVYLYVYYMFYVMTFPHKQFRMTFSKMKIVSQSVIFISVSATTALIHIVLVGFLTFFFIFYFRLKVQILNLSG